jgi:acid phosphatase type 7
VRTCRGLPGRVRAPAAVVVLLLVVSGCVQNRPSRPESPTATSAESRPTGGPVTIIGAGDIAGLREAAQATADLIRAADPSAVFTTGDNAYPRGTSSDYAGTYDATWGAFKDRTHPVPGNHEYLTDGASGYVDYFGAPAVTNPDDGGLYYAWDVGDGWRAYAMNTEISTSGAQLSWLEDDVAAHPAEHYLLVTHNPRFTSGAEHGPDEDVCPLWDALAATGKLELVLSGHNHQYERFAPMDCSGRRGSDGVRSFVIGSGGNSLYGFGDLQPGSEFHDDTHFGVLELTLHPDSYDWEFLASGRAQAGSRTTDAGNAGEVLDKGSAGV